MEGVRVCVNVRVWLGTWEDLRTRNSSGEEIAKCDFSVYLFILQLSINSSV